VRVRTSGGRRTMLHRVGPAREDMRTGAVRGQDTAVAVQSPSRSSANEVRVSRVGVAVGQGSSGQGASQTPHLALEAPPRPAALHGVVYRAPASAAPRVVCAAAEQAPWVRHLRRGAREDGQSPPVLPQRQAYPDAVAQSTQSTTERHLARLHRSTQALQDRTPTDSWAVTGKKRSS